MGSENSYYKCYSAVKVRPYTNMMFIFFCPGVRGGGSPPPSPGTVTVHCIWVFALKKLLHNYTKIKIFCPGGWWGGAGVWVILGGSDF